MSAVIVGIIGLAWLGLGYWWYARRLDRKGNKTSSTKNGDHLRMNVMGMVCPRTGEFFRLRVSDVAAPARRNVLIVDNASWRPRKSTPPQAEHAWEPIYLPPYSPDLKPIEPACQGPTADRGSTIMSAGPSTISSTVLTRPSSRPGGPTHNRSKKPPQSERYSENDYRGLKGFAYSFPEISGLGASGCVVRSG